jgi:beta-glucosidase
VATELAYTGGALATAIAEGMTNESMVDESLTRVLSLRMRLGMFDPLEDQPYAQIPASSFGR